MSRLDVDSVLTNLRNARRQTIMAWTPDAQPDEAHHLMNALLDLELAIVQVERHEEDEAAAARHAGESSEFRGMVAATQGRPVDS